MKIGHKISFVVCCIFAIIIFLVVGAQKYMIAPGFEEIEKWFIHNEVEWINDLIDREGERLSALCKDWAEWDDTYEYVFSRDEDYVITNLSEETLSLNFLNFAAIVDKDGNIVIAKSFDLETEEFIASLFDGFDGDKLSESNPLFVITPGDSVSGIAKSVRGPAFIAAYPILHTDRSGPAAGTLIMGHVFDGDFLGDTFTKGGHSVKITEEKHADCGSDTYDDTYITNYTSGSYSVCKEMSTVYGDVNYVLQLITPNFVGLHNEKYNRIITFLMLVVCSVGLILIMAVVMKIVIRPIGGLAMQIRDMRKRNALDYLPKRNAKDEITVLASQFNQMVSRIKEDQRVNDQITQKLKDSNSELQRFAYSVSHDLKEPLRTVTSYLQLIEHTMELNDDTREYMGFVTGATKRMYNLISDLLEYSKSDSVDYPAKECDMASVVNEITDELQLTIEETGAVIDAKGMPVVMGYEPLLKQLLRNLINNAIKYRRADVKPQIEIGGSEDEKEYTFYVKDNGKGIEKEYEHKVFEMFQRLEADDRSGSGLGLAICRKAVEKHDGRIWVESEYGKGSTFFFTISKQLKKEK